MKNYYRMKNYHRKKKKDDKTLCPIYSFLVKHNSEKFYKNFKEIGC